jgi:DNA repair exonuclease SbcCD ATPase subunit
MVVQMSFDQKKLISKLMEVKQDLFEIIERKFEEIEKIQGEIRHLEQRMEEIDRLIGINNLMDAESFLAQKKEEPIKNVEEIRTIFSPMDAHQPLIKMKYDGKQLEIDIIKPNVIQLKQQSSEYIERILQPLFPLKETEKDMEVIVDKQNDLGMITKLIIKNLYKAEYIDEVFKVFQDLVNHI